MEVGNKMESFILTKYITYQYYLVSINHPPHNSVQHIYEEWDMPINVHWLGI